MSKTIDEGVERMKEEAAKEKLLEQKKKEE